MALNQGCSAAVGLSAGRWADRNGHTGIITLGGVIAAAGYLWLALGADTSPTTWTYLFPALIVAGVGSMMIGTTISSAAFVDLDDAVLGRATSSYYVTRRLGSAAGAVAAVAILGDVVGDGLVDRFKWVWIFSAACHIVSSIVMRYGFAGRASRWPAPAVDLA